MNMFSTEKTGEMLINKKSTEQLRDSLEAGREVFCSGLFLSARWFVFSSAVQSGIHLIVLPDKELVKAYEKGYHKFRKLYPLLKDVYPLLDEENI